MPESALSLSLSCPRAGFPPRAPRLGTPGAPLPRQGLQPGPHVVGVGIDFRDPHEEIASSRHVTSPFVQVTQCVPLAQVTVRRVPQRLGVPASSQEGDRPTEITGVGQCPSPTIRASAMTSVGARPRRSSVQSSATLAVRPRAR